jgi:hypothetical protein
MVNRFFWSIWCANAEELALTDTVLAETGNAKAAVYLPEGIPRAARDARKQAANPANVDCSGMPQNQMHNMCTGGRIWILQNRSFANPWGT